MLARAARIYAITFRKGESRVRMCAAPALKIINHIRQNFLEYAFIAIIAGMFFLSPARKSLNVPFLRNAVITE
jgi:hypothetical protein